MTHPGEMWDDLNERWPTPVAAYKYPLTLLIVGVLDDIRRFLVWYNSRFDSTSEIDGGADDD